MTAFWKYYLDSTIYNLGFSTLASLYAGPLWGFIVFGTIGTFIGLMIYAYFKQQEYYFYYNLGYSKRKLITQVCLFNLLTMAVCFTLYAILFQ